jgi:hypothetical protein
MQIDINSNYDIESFYGGFDEGYTNLDEEDMQEVAICEKCLESTDDCECDKYDIDELETDCNGQCFSDADPGL